MHRFDIMVSAISIALYHTIKKLVAKKKGCRSDKTDPFRKCHLEKFFLVIHIDICTHIVDKYILFYIYTHTHTRNKYVPRPFDAGENTKQLSQQFLKIMLSHAI